MSRIRRFASEHNLGRYRRPSMPVVAALALVLVLVCASLAGVGVILTSDKTPKARAGTPVPAALRQPIATAALSCPTLTPARLDGQLMAASGFNQTATSIDGGKGIAGLTDAAWARWAPDPQATRTDPASTVLALAHQMCDLVGAVRAAKVSGDPWRNALAAYRVGTDAVVKAHGAPPTATAYVDLVASYAAWYAVQPAPSRSINLAGGNGYGPALPVPAAYLHLVRGAGRACAAVTPSRVAGQLMAASGFQPDLLGPAGAVGVAQFLPDTWAQYAPSATASPGDPNAAIPALGSAMCDLIRQLAPIGGDPYQLALAAFRLGSQPVRQAGKVPESTEVGDFVKAALGYAQAYATDPTLSAGQLASAAGPSGSPATSTPPSAGQAGNPPPTVGQVGNPPPTSGQAGNPPAQSSTQWTVVTVPATRVLEVGQSVQSNRTRLVMESGGNLAVYDETGKQRWSSGTAGRGHRAIFQGDGNLVVFDQNQTPLWTSNTAGHNGATLVLEADGNVCVVYQGVVIWAANTAH